MIDTVNGRFPFSLRGLKVAMVLGGLACWTGIWPLIVEQRKKQKYIWHMRWYQRSAVRV